MSGAKAETSIVAERVSLEEQIEHGQRTRKKVRCRVSGALLLAGLVLQIFYLFLKVKFNLYVDVSKDPERTCRDHLLTICVAFMFQIRYLLLNMAPLPDDLLLTRCVIVFDALSVVMDVCLQQKELSGHVETKIWYIFGTSFYFVALIWAGLSINALKMQERIWTIFLVIGVTNVFFCTAVALKSTLTQKVFSAMWWYSFSYAFSLWIIQDAQARNRIQGWLRVFFAVHDPNTRAGASIAGLVGDCSPKSMKLEAAQRFRCVNIESLAFEDVAVSTPDMSLFERSYPTRLGMCDAFISHSWHDCAEAKWEALQAWRREFVRRHGREPTVWMDRCCIDQNNIEANLRCLPVFLTGCTRVVVLFGVTYLSRLWCVVELFTYLHAGGSMDFVDLHQVVRKDKEYEDSVGLASCLNNFDVQRSTCFKSAEADHMLAIISAAFGSLEDFNVTIRGIMKTLSVHEFGPVSRNSSSSAGSTASFTDSDSSEGGSNSCCQNIRPAHRKSSFRFPSWRVLTRGK